MYYSVKNYLTFTFFLALYAPVTPDVLATAATCTVTFFFDLALTVTDVFFVFVTLLPTLTL